MTALYRFYNEQGSLLYVGITRHLPRRLAQHSTAKAWWTSVSHVRVQHYPSPDEARVAEREAIRLERPQFNVADIATSPVGDIEFHAILTRDYDRRWGPLIREAIGAYPTMTAEEIVDVVDHVQTYFDRYLAVAAAVGGHELDFDDVDGGGA